MMIVNQRAFILEAQDQDTEPELEDKQMTETQVRDKENSSEEESIGVHVRRWMDVSQFYRLLAVRMA